MTADERQPVPGQLLYSPEQAAALLGMSRAKLYELQVRDQIRSVKIDGMRRYHVRDLEAFAEQARAAS
jgi:excisionase family DNA binding protein